MVIYDFLKQYAANSFRHSESCRISTIVDGGKALSFPEDDLLVSDFCKKLSGVIASSFGTYPDDESAHVHINNAEYIALAHTEDTLLGFACAIKLPSGHLYLREVAMTETSKGLGLTQACIRTLSELSDCDDIIFITQNPVMYQILEKLYQQVYPSVKHQMVPEKIQKEMMSLLARYKNPDHIKLPEQGVIQRFYRQSLYHNPPCCADRDINKWFMDKLEMQEGHTRDAFCFVGESLKH